MRRFLRENSLSLVFGGLFMLVLLGQAVAGTADYNNQRRADELPTISVGRYLTSSEFGVDVAENWQSEYLQFFLYVFGTVWLLQRGSPESKELDKAGPESDEQQMIGPYAKRNSPRWAAVGGWRTAIYGRSLGLVMLGLFVGSLAAQSVAGWSAYNGQQLRQLQAPVPWSDYVTSPDFWNRALQNWQSELLAVGSMVVLSIYLRQRGSPESKPVGASHESTGVSG